ncbi:MAG: hypothetical protein ACT4PV_02815 [Planctomycetaceae bacterium]
MTGPLRRLFALPPPEVTAPRWHVSPLVDVVAYHFSWVWLLVPLLLLGQRHPQDYLLIFLGVLTLNFSHQALSLPYVYLDSEVFRAHRLRCTLFPLVMLGGFLLCVRLWQWRVPIGHYSAMDFAIGAGVLLLLLEIHLLARRGHRLRWLQAALFAVAPLSPWLLGFAPAPAHWPGLAGLGLFAVLLARGATGRAPMWLAGTIALAAAALFFLPGSDHALWPRKSFGFHLVIGAVSGAAYLWNFWHIYMQKFGILRLYNAKSQAPPEAKAPPWVDRLLVFGWLPLTVLVIGMRYRAELMRNLFEIRPFLGPVIDAVSAAAPYGIAPAAAVALASVVFFLRQEWRAHRFRNAPRLSAAAGFVLLSASMLVLNPIKAVLAFGFSHAVEYFVFVWAFLRRKYRVELPHRPILQRALRRPLLAWVVFFLFVSGGYFVFITYGGYIFRGRPGIRVGGIPAGQIVMVLGIFQALVHFYFDGFLWKMRTPQVRKSI